MIAAFTLDDIDKTIYEAIRLQCVSYGLLPDITISSDYELEKNLIAAERGGYIEVFGQGSWFARGKKMTNRFVVDRHTITKGDIGGGFTLTEEYVDDNGDTRVKIWKAPQQSKDILYEIRFVGLDNTFELVSHQILAKALSDNKYIKCLSGRENTANLEFQIYLQNSYDASNLEFHERVWNFKVPNIFFYEDYEFIRENVLIKQIQTPIYGNEQNVSTIVTDDNGLEQDIFDSQIDSNGNYYYNNQTIIIENENNEEVLDISWLEPLLDAKDLEMKFDEQTNTFKDIN